MLSLKGEGSVSKKGNCRVTGERAVRATCFLLYLPRDAPLGFTCDMGDISTPRFRNSVRWPAAERRSLFCHFVEVAAWTASLLGGVRIQPVPLNAM